MPAATGVVDANGEPSGLGDALRSAATVDLYRANAFRVAGLAVDATSGDIRRRTAELRAMRALGAAPPQDRQALPLHPPPEIEQIETAMARLRDPLNRLVDGFFWFWPDGDTDPGLAALTAGDVDRAEQAWESARTPAATHNLAVLNHALALDDEHAGKPPPRSGASLRWRRTYQHWLASWRSDAVWDLLAERVARLGHPGFGPSTAPAFRERLPRVLASTSAAVALRGAERGLPDEALMVHWRLTNYQGFPPDTRAAAVRAATESIVERLQARIDRAALALQQRPETAPESAEQLDEQAGPLLRTLALARTADADGMHDAVARQLFGCALVSLDRTITRNRIEDWRRTLGLLKLAMKHARGAAVIKQIREKLSGRRTGAGRDSPDGAPGAA